MLRIVYMNNLNPLKVLLSIVLLVAIIVLVIAFAGPNGTYDEPGTPSNQNPPTETPTTPGNDTPDTNADIRVTIPQANATVSSPLIVSGEARGGWYFEASFPVRLLDGDGNQIAIGIAQAQGEWMTENFVPFIATLTFTNPETETGTLVFEKDNPSGLPENAAEFRVPVRFSTTNN